MCRIRVDLPHVEAAQPFGLLLADVDALDGRSSGAVSHEPDQLVDCLCLSLEDRFDGAVVAV